MIEREPMLVDGVEMSAYTLTNGPMRAVVTDAGARLLELHVPDSHGRTADIVLSRATPEEIVADSTFMGATAGRYANRIRGGRFDLDGRTYTLATNEGTNHLHGGERGFDRYQWSVQTYGDEPKITFRRISADGEEGYPGQLTCAVTYALEPDALAIEMRAVTDAPTVLNIVNHAYVNLAGHDAGNILDHEAVIHASHYLPVDDELLPTGQIEPVAGTAFDFTTAHTFGERKDQVSLGGAVMADNAGGYDHNWCLDGAGMRAVACFAEPVSGRTLTLVTNQPGVQIYTGGYLAGTSAKGGGTYEPFAGFTIETQCYPDTPNHPEFGSCRLDPGQTYENRVRLEFGVR